MKKPSVHHLPGGYSRTIIIRIGENVELLRTSEAFTVIELPDELNPSLGPGAVADILHISRSFARRLIAGGKLKETGEKENRAQTDLNSVVDFLLGNTEDDK